MASVVFLFAGGMAAAAPVKYGDFRVISCNGCGQDGMQREAEYHATPLMAGTHKYIVMDTINARVSAYAVEVEREPGFSFVGAYEIAVPQIFKDTFEAEKHLFGKQPKTSVTVAARSDLGATAGEAMLNDVAVRQAARAAATPGLIRALELRLGGKVETVTVTMVFPDQSKIVAEVVSGLDAGAAVRILSVKDANGRQIYGAESVGTGGGGGSGLIGLEIRPIGTVHSSGWYFCGPDGNGGEECYPIPAPKEAN